MRSLQLSILSNPTELRSYHYFWKQVLPLLPGHYDHLFWGTWVRQACFSEPAIQHAMIAVGALHESIGSNFAGNTWAATWQQSLAIQQYNKAIQYLIGNDAHTMATELTLTSCIIFIMFENLYGRNSEALKHLTSGIAMLKSWMPTTESEHAVKTEYLTPIYTRGYVHETSMSLPTAFETLEAARKHLQILLDIIYSSVDSAIMSEEPAAVNAKITDARRSLQDWHALFVKLREPKDKEQRRAKVLLRLQYDTALILLAAVLLDDECGYDASTDTFRDIVRQCEQLVALESTLIGTDADKDAAFTYGFDLNILPPLNITAFKCRDPQLRRRAIAMLSAGNRYEGLWNGKTVARIAQRTLELEENGLQNVSVCGDIPGRQRARVVAIAYDPGTIEYESSIGAHFKLEWSRNIVNGEPLESVSERLSVSAEEKYSSWGPGRSPWHMSFQYDPEWSQWKMWYLPRDTPSTDTPSTEHIQRNNLESSAATRRHVINRPGCRPFTSFNRSARRADSEQASDEADKVCGKQHISLFWDHWRLKKMPIEDSGTTAVEMEKEAARGGRSYGDAQADEGTETHPSHLLISLP